MSSTPQLPVVSRLYHLFSASLFSPKWVSEWVKSLSRVRLFATPWTVAPQAPPSMGFSRQEYWSGLPFPSPECYYQICISLFSYLTRMATLQMYGFLPVFFMTWGMIVIFIIVLLAWLVWCDHIIFVPRLLCLILFTIYLFRIDFILFRKQLVFPLLLQENFGSCP